MNLRRHELDPISLVVGLLCALIATAALSRDVWEFLRVDGDWVLPVVLIGSGLVGLVLALRPQRDPEQVSPSTDGG